MIQDIVGTIYLLWPITVVGFGFVFMAGFLFAISLGFFFTIGVLITYYTYIYLKKKGVFDFLVSWLQTKNKLVGQKLQKNVQETFVLKGHLDKVPEGAVLYLAHPHGLFSMAPFLHWSAQVTHWPSERPVHIAIHSIFFRIPLVRELCEYFGAIEAEEGEISEILKQGESVAILAGGIREISATTPGQMKLFLKKRKGFARIAKDLGIPIVPVLTFGENELFPPLEGFWTEKVQSYLRAWVGISMPLPTLESFLNWFRLLRGPLPSRVTTWIGKPVFTDKKNCVETTRKHVFLAFQDLYKEGRPTEYPQTLEIL